MTALSPPAPGSLHDPAQEHSYNAYSTHPHYAGLGLQHTASPPEASSPTLQQRQQQQPSTKSLAITSRATGGAHPPPLMGSAIVLVNNSALHCFGGRLENRELTNCHYVLDIETGHWQAIQPAPGPSSHNDKHAIDPKALQSLSLSTDPVNTNSGSLSDTLSLPPRSRYFHTLNAYGTSIILFGGMGTLQTRIEGEDSDNEGAPQAGQLAALDDLHVYDIVTQRWQQKHPSVNQHSPRARWAHMTTILDHFLVVIGGTDTNKVYIEDACVLDLHSWEWVASVKNIGQCGSYRTVAATGPGLQSSSEYMPASQSFPSADASSPQISSSLSWQATELGTIDAMASLSMVLSGRISAPSSTTSSQSNHSTEIVKETKDPSKSNSSSRKTSERLTSAELAPAFKIGREPPSIYLYSNYNFQKLQRELKIITPHYTPSSATPTFTLVDKTQTLERKGHELPPGLRFPQGHVYQNQLILTGTLIMPGKAPTLALYAFNLSLDKWEKLDTDTTLLTGSWNRTVLHPATGTLLIFGHRESNAEADYSSRIQHHDHLMSINLQAYGLYERPIPSFLPTAQDLGQDMLREPGLNDMHLVSASGTLFGANSTILAARWPEFSTMLLSPPYVTPLILVLPVPDEVISVFLHYLYTGALPLHTVITPGMADYLLILARRYQLNGLHALTIDLLHQGVVANPVRIYSSALLAGELGLQARAVGLAMTALPAKPPTSRPSSSLSNPATMPGANAMTPSMPPPLSARRRPSMQPQILDSSLSRSYSNRVPPPSSRPPVTPERRQRAPSQHSRDSMSTDGGIVGESLSQQYNPSTIVDGGRLTPTVYMSSPEPGLTGPNSSRQRKLRTPPTPSNFQQSAFSQHPMSFISTSSGGSNYDSPMASPVLARGPQILQQYQQAYPSPLSPSSQQMPSFASYGGHIRGSGPGSDGGAPSVYSHDDQDERGDLRAQQAKRRLHMQMQMQMQSEMDLQQQVLVEQQHMRDEEIMLQQRSLRQQQQQQQQRGKPEVEPVVYHNPAAAMMGALDHHMGGSYANSSNQSTKSSKGGSHYPSSQMTAETQLTIGTESTVETVSSRKSGSSKATSVKSSGSDEKKKGLLSKMKPPKPKASGAALMKSAGF